MDRKLLIGEFAATTGVSKRMLRHYDKLNLLTPALIDQGNGYRYYSETQIAAVRTITILQDYGFSLSEICSLKDQEITTDDFLQHLKSKELHIRHSIDEHTAHLLNITRTIRSLRNQSTPGLDNKFNLKQLNLERSQPMTLEPNPYITTVNETKNLVDKLPTTAFFLEQLEERVHHKPDIPKAFCTFDLDRFAPINDLYGYDIGDRVIYQFFKFVLDIYGPHIDGNKALVSRFGGDEVVVYLENTSEEEAVKLAKQVLEALRNFDFNHLECGTQLTSSCGIYFFRNIDHIQAPRHESGMGLIEAKRNGSDCIVLRHQA